VELTNDTRDQFLYNIVVNIMSYRSNNRNKSTSSGLSRRQQHNADKRRSANAVGLTDFSQKKGQVRALEEFKKRKNRKQLQTSMALRKYRKLMKQEGLEAGTGASRKRSANESDQEEEVEWNDREETNDSQDEEETVESNKVYRKRQRADQIDSDESKSGSDIDDDDSEEDEQDLEETQQDKPEKKKKQTRPKKMDPFEKSREKAKLAKQRAEEAALRRASNEKERQQKLKRRRQQTKLLQQRTKRGQPIMKHAIDNLLYKLEKQQTNTGKAINVDHRRQKSTSHDASKTKEKRPQEPTENLPQKKKKKARKFY